MSRRKHFDAGHGREEYRGGQETPTYYHATNAALNPGDYLIPTSESGITPNWGGHKPYRSDRVYFFDHNLLDSLMIENWGEHIYEVAPEGKVEPDPERAPHEWDHPSDDPAAYSYVAPLARVIKKINGR